MTKPYFLTFRWIALWAFVMIAPCSFGIVENNDTLVSSLAGKPDSVQVGMLLNFVQQHYREQPIRCQNYIEHAISISQGVKNDRLLAKSYSLAGVLHKNKAEYPEALENHFMSLSINEKLGSKPDMASNYNDIGIIYKTMQEFDKALEYYLKSNALVQELGYNRGIVMTFNNIGTIYEAKENLPDAISYYNKALQKAEEFNIIDAQAIVLNNLGEIYATMGDQVKALSSFKQTLHIDSISQDRFGMTYSLLNVAATYMFMNKFDSSLYYFGLSKTIAEELDSPQHLIHVYAGLTQLYEKQKDYKAAFNALSKFKTLQDTVYNQSTAQRLAEAEAKYGLALKENEIRLLTQEQFIKQIEIKQHKAELAALISLIISASFIIIYLYFRYKHKQFALFNKQLLIQKEKHLAAIVETQEKERKRIAKDLHDGVGQTLSGVKLAMVALGDELKEIEPPHGERYRKIIEIVDSACTEVRTISHQMMPRMLQEEGLIPAITDMLEKSFLHSPISHQFEHFGLDKRLKENVEVGVYRICQELIHNIIKHSGASHVNVQLFKNGKILVLLVEDNGKGFEFSTLKSNGIGLMNISSRVETIHGEFNLEPSPDSGTLATIRIPIE